MANATTISSMMSAPAELPTILPAMGLADQYVSSASGAAYVGRGISATEVVIAQAVRAP